MKGPVGRALAFCRNVFSRDLEKKSRSGRQRFRIEPLETRLLLSVDLMGIPGWIPDGPQPILDAPSVSAAPGDAAGGAVQSIAINPNNAQQIYIGTVNGGIWRSNNADPANPDDVTWSPLTDQLESLAIGSIEFSSLDPAGNTLYAGTGSFSNLTWGSPPPTAIGVLRTTDGGTTWSNFAVNPLNEGRIKTIVPTGVDLDPGPGVEEMILVATIDGGAGLYRSDNNGETFNLLSGANNLPTGVVSQLIVDPNNAQRYYAALPGRGVYQGDFAAGTGVITWTQVNGTNPNNLTNVLTSANIQITAHDDGGNTVLYAGLANAVAGGTVNATLTGVFRSTDAGANWTALGVPAVFNAFSVSGSGFAMIADPADDQVAYIGGLSDGDNVYRYDPGLAAWVLIVGAGAQGPTQPHADPREYAFIGDDILVEVDDGGLYFLENPTDALNNSWQSLNGEVDDGNALGAIEIHSIAWDSVSDILIAGAQDNGTSIQHETGSRIWDGIFGGDGGDVLVDAFTLAGANQSIRYFSSQNLGIRAADPQGNFRRQVYDATNGTVGAAVEVLPAAGLANFNPRFVNPIEINAIAPTAAQLGAGQSTRIVVGGGGASPVYESNDAGVAAAPTWTAVPVGAGFGNVTALAYGGRSGGVDNPDVLYAGDDNGNVFVRTTAGGPLNATATPFPGATVSDIALDPNDWQHAFVTSSNGVWETTNRGATWTLRTGNLSNNIIQTVEYVDLGGVDVVLVGGLGGVFRMITNNPDVWTEYGAFIPNATTYDLDYNATDDVLIAGLFGRGAWEIDNASDTLAVPGVVEIFGDENGFAEDDVIRLIRQAANPSLLDIFINSNTPTATVQMSAIQQINVYGLGGNDRLEVDSTNGLINVGSGIRYDGGSGGFDELQLLQTGGPVHASDTYSVGPAIGSGVSLIVGAPGAGTQTVFFEDLEPVLDLVPVAVLVVNATPADNAINVSGLVTTGLVTVDEHESIEFANKIELIIEAGSGRDTIGVNSAITPTGLTEITINGANPADGDAVIVNGVGVAATVNTTTGVITGAAGAGGAIAINFTTIESLHLTAVGDLTITTTGADDTATVTPGLSTGANSGTVQSSGAVPQISFVNSGAFTANLGAGDDALIVNASADVDTIAVSGVAVAITGRRTVNVSGTETVRVNGQGGSDTLNVTPSASVGIFIDGGDPVGVIPGDLLNVVAGGGMVTYNAGPETDEGSVVVGVNQPVSFDHIESVSISGSGPAVINGTNGPDAITVIARDVSTHAAANGVQDFTVSVNTGPDLLFINVASLTLNALSGSDQVTLQTPAPNGAIWDVDVTVNGGPPAGDTDRLIVQTPGAGAEVVVYTPGAFDGGTLNLVSLSSLVTINSTENLSYDGQGDNDNLSIAGTGGSDVIVHTPGANNDAGTIQVNGLLGLSYQNLGATASLTADGSGGEDTLVVHGTAANDSFTVGAAGQVNLNARVPVSVASIETLTLEGFAGNDAFTLVPAISASVYTTMNFNGGSQSSAAGDVVNLVATAGDDDINVSGQTVSLGTRTVQSSGVEDIRLDALGGDDLLTYTGVSGITEDIRVASSGVAGGGQLSAPGVTLVDFSGVERVDVHGNAPTPTETDTLTFAGTNAVDVFQINLAADGSDADPILKLETSAAALLLTLRNYTNFATLNVLGLDGEDTFNVTVDETGPSRDLFVNGGIPQGKKKSTDNLNIFYVPPRPSIIHSAATQDPDAGLVDLDYDTARYVIQYDGIEQIVIRRDA